MSIDKKECLDTITHEFKDVFAEKLGKYKFEEIDLKLKDNVSGI